jgi:hypothetical protein
MNVIWTCTMTPELNYRSACLCKHWSGHHLMTKVLRNTLLQDALWVNSFIYLFNSSNEKEKRDCVCIGGGVCVLALGLQLLGLFVPV